MSDYDPNSHDAVLSRILTELQAMRTTQLENRDLLNNTLGRVAALEQFKVWVLGAAAGVSALMAGIVLFVQWIYDKLKH